MIVLAIDSAAAGCGVCVWQDGRILASVQEKMERGQDSRLVPLIQETLAGTGLTFADLDRIAVTRGPGSFTGLRIGLATARGIGLAAGKPIIGVDRFSIYRAQLAARKEAILIVLESKRQELYTRYFPSYGQAQTARLMTPEEIAVQVQSHHDILIVGDAIETLRGAVDRHVFDEMATPEVETCALLASVADPVDPQYLPRPLYLRAPDVTIQVCDDP